MPRNWRADGTSEGSRKFIKARQELEFRKMKEVIDANKPPTKNEDNNTNNSSSSPNSSSDSGSGSNKT